MELVRHPYFLEISSEIYFDDEKLFCGRPWVHLFATRDNSSYGWSCYSLRIGITDHDDYHTGLIYQTDEENFDSVLHELVNWMRDHEQGISSYDELVDTMRFFPDCGCERIIW